MAGIPLKSGADFYNLEASRMRLHNLGADPTEVGTGLIYFNTSTGMNTSGRARIYTGNGFKSLAFLEDVDGRIKTIEDMLNVDTAEGVVSTWNEIQAFLDSVQEGTDLMDLLNSKLDKTGGTIESEYSDALKIKRTGVAGASGIAFYNSADGLLGNIGIGGSQSPYGKVPYFNDGTTTYAILTSAGGTIKNGSKVNPFNIDTDATDTLYISLKSKGEAKAYFAWNAGWGIYLQDSAANRLGLRPEGTPFYRTNDVNYSLLHSGNIGEYNAGGIKVKQVAATDDLSNYIDSGTGISFYTNDRGAVIGDIGSTSATLVFGHAANRMGRFIYQRNNESNILYWQSANGSANAWGTKRKVAFTDSNVASATKLETPRTIWGNSFDGTADVDGHFFFYNSRYITSYDTNGDEVKLMNLSGSNEFSLGYYVAQKGYSTNISGNNIYLKSGTSNNIGLILNSSGNVGIGTTNPAVKLEVNGDITARDVSSGAGKLVTAENSRGRIGIYASANRGIYDFSTSEWLIATNGVNTWLSRGNVLIGTTDDDNSGAKLQVNGGISLGANAIYGVQGKKIITSNSGELYFGTSDTTALETIVTGKSLRFRVGANANNVMYITEGGNVGIGTSNPTEKLHVVGDLHVTGNIIADGEVSAGKAAEESGEGGNTGGGSAAFSKTFTPSTTTVSVNHNISSEDVIVQVYEKDATSGKWSVILVDIEIVDSTRVDLHFGRTETTEHKVVIIG